MSRTAKVGLRLYADCDFAFFALYSAQRLRVASAMRFRAAGLILRFFGAGFFVDTAAV